MKIAVVMNLDWPLKRYHKLFAGIKSYANDHTNWTICWDPYPETNLLNDSTYYDGIIGRCELGTIETAKKLNIPIVNTWHSNFEKSELSVFPDYPKAGELAAETITKRGYTNFVSINYKDGSAAKQFLKGVDSVLKVQRFPHKKYFFPRNLEKNRKRWDTARKNFSEWVQSWDLPVAIITSISGLGPKISALCSENNIQIPEDAVLISSDNDLNYCEGISPTISSVNIDYFDVGFQAAKLLDKKLQKQKIVYNHILVPPSGVAYRESTCHLVIDDTLVRKAISFIADNYHKNIQISDVARNFPISRRSLEQRFKDTVGHTIHEEISRLRLETIKLLLLKSDKNLKTLSKEAGFSDEFHMRRAFKINTGMLPKEYRATKRKH